VENTIYLDIETLPTRRQDIIDRIAADIQPPASIKKPETLVRWEETERPGAIKKAVEKTSFDPAAGQICTIAWAVGGGEIVAAHDETGEGEALVLQSFFDAVFQSRASQFVGHYISGFDLRFILCRAVVLGVSIPSLIPRDPKPWEKTVFDTMVAWSGSRGTISLDNLCQALGIEGKGDVDGSMVAGLWEAGEHEAIIEYCKDDVAKVRAIHKRFQAVGF